jgi:hypothetical protein
MARAEAYRNNNASGVNRLIHRFNRRCSAGKTHDIEQKHGSTGQQHIRIGNAGQEPGIRTAVGGYPSDLWRRDGKRWERNGALSIKWRVFSGYPQRTSPVGLVKEAPIKGFSPSSKTSNHHHCGLWKTSSRREQTSRPN